MAEAALVRGASRSTAACPTPEEERTRPSFYGPKIDVKLVERHRASTWQT